jgi:anthranilate phosphoribosyltransferase
LAAALQRLGCQRAVVVCGKDGLDEVTLDDETEVSEVTPEGVQETAWSPTEFGLPRADLTSLRVDGPEASAALIRQVLDGQPGPARDIVVMNAAAALWTVRRADSLRQCAALAAAALDNGAAKRLLAEFVEVSRQR